MLVVTERLPVVAAQLMEKCSVVVSPAATVTVCEAPPLTVQFVGTSVSATVWVVAESPL